MMGSGSQFGCELEASEERAPTERSVRWTGWDSKGLEHCTLRHSSAGLTLEGVVAGNRQGVYGAHYRVRTDARFRTREVHVRYVCGPALHVEADGDGNWTDRISGASLPSLAGCLDVDIGVTPATNTLPVLRLRLERDQSRDILAAYVPLPDQVDAEFVPQLARQRYTCIEPGRRHRYEGLFRGFSAILETDDVCLVLDYPDTFRRVP